MWLAVLLLVLLSVMVVCLAHALPGKKRKGRRRRDQVANAWAIAARLDQDRVP